MTQLIVDADLGRKLLEVKNTVEVCDPSGRVLGKFSPKLNPDDYDLTVPSFTEEELRASEQHPVSYTTAEVLERLRKL